MMDRQLVSDQGTMADLLMKSAILFLLSFGVGSIALHAVSALPLTASAPRIERAVSHAPSPDASGTRPDAAVASPDGPAVTDRAVPSSQPMQPPSDVAAVIFPEDPPDRPRLAVRPEPMPAVVPLPRNRPQLPKTMVIRATASADMPTIRQVATIAAVAKVPEPEPQPAPPAEPVSAPSMPQIPTDWRPGSDRLRHATIEALDYVGDIQQPLLGADLESFAKLMNAYAEMRWQARGLEIGERAAVLDRRIVERTGELARAGRITPNQFPRRARSFIEAASHTVPALAPMTEDLAGEPKPFRWW